MGLVGMLRAASIKPTLFAMGPTALLVARQIFANMPAAFTPAAGSPRPTPASPATECKDPPAASYHGSASPPPPSAASLLLVDRTLDLVSPAMRTDHPLDILLTAHAKTAENGAWTHSPSAPASPPCAPQTQTQTGEARPPPPPPPPTVASPLSTSVLQALDASDPACAELLERLLSRRSKEVCMCMHLPMSPCAPAPAMSASSSRSRDTSRYFKIPRDTSLTHLPAYTCLHTYLPSHSICALTLTACTPPASRHQHRGTTTFTAQVSQQVLKTLAALADETEDIVLSLPSRPTPSKLRELPQSHLAAPPRHLCPLHTACLPDNSPPRELASHMPLPMLMHAPR